MSSSIIQLNEAAIKSELSNLVRKTVEETLNAFLEQEAQDLVSAERYARTNQRKGYRSGHYERNFTTTAGDVTLHIPKLKGLTFTTAIIERYRRRETSIEEALVEMYLAGVSTRRVEDISEMLWGNRISAGTLSNLNKEVYQHIEEWRNRPITGEYAYVYVDGTYLKRSWGGEVRNVAVLVAVGVNQDGYREILGAVEGMKEDKESWRSFFIHLKERGFQGAKLFVGDKCLGMLETLGEVFPDAQYQRCVVHFYRNVFSVVPKGKVTEVAQMLKAIHAQEDKQSARKKAAEVIDKLKEMKLYAAAKKVENGIEETLTFMHFPSQHWRKIRTTNMLERVNKEIKRRTRSVGAFPDGNSALMLVCARLQYVAQSQWGTRRYMSIEHFLNWECEQIQPIAA